MTMLDQNTVVAAPRTLQHELSTEEVLEKLDRVSPRRAMARPIWNKSASMSHLPSLKIPHSPVKRKDPLSPRKSSLPHSPRKIFRHNRSNSIGNSLSNLMSSFSSLLHESSADLSLGSSLGSIQDIEFNDLTFVKDLDNVIDDLEKSKNEADPKIRELETLARARYESGNEFGAILSMRKIHRIRTRKAYYSGARYQLKQMREKIEDEMNEGNFDFDFLVLFEHAKRIVSNAKTASCPAPPDNELRKRLHQMLGSLEI